jgi:hypothetical protein
VTADSRSADPAVAVAPDASSNTIAADSLWYRDAVIYELHIKA